MFICIKATPWGCYYDKKSLIKRPVKVGRLTKDSLISIMGVSLENKKGER